jgi:hypothetical protein
MKNSFSKSLVGILVTGVFLIGDFSVTTALATDCRACGECQERNRKRKEDSDKCKKECLESQRVVIHTAVFPTRVSLSLCQYWRKRFWCSTEIRMRSSGAPRPHDVKFNEIMQKGGT